MHLLVYLYTYIPPSPQPSIPLTVHPRDTKSRQIQTNPYPLWIAKRTDSPQAVGPGVTPVGCADEGSNVNVGEREEDLRSGSGWDIHELLMSSTRRSGAPQIRSAVSREGRTRKKKKRKMERTCKLSVAQQGYATVARLGQSHLLGKMGIGSVWGLRVLVLVLVVLVGSVLLDGTTVGRKEEFGGAVVTGMWSEVLSLLEGTVTSVADSATLGAADGSASSFGAAKDVAVAVVAARVKNEMIVERRIGMIFLV
ncbi:hypothetical protein DM02DRAFT_623281 [Periconia macrospinosa]|uniref:Uncharacterized protein n=1 Tax=Periconia macrospinosa TaxID=97972 RepID=A0A2V1EAH6_9PLEO|nr:hypothetical protein DM02DRAFT_623281 [Periconia macrospinosa]